MLYRDIVLQKTVCKNRASPGILSSPVALGRRVLFALLGVECVNHLIDELGQSLRVCLGLNSCV